MDVRLYYYHLGESDERKKLNGERVSDLSFKNQTSCFYRLGSLSERHRNHPTRSALLFELTREFCYNCYSSELPNLITVQLNSHYSHRLIKTILDELGYRVSAMEKDFECFHVWRVVWILNILPKLAGYSSQFLCPFCSYYTIIYTIIYTIAKLYYFKITLLRKLVLL